MAGGENAESVITLVEGKRIDLTRSLRYHATMVINCGIGFSAVPGNHKA